jgi:hypothetical protein
LCGTPVYVVSSPEKRFFFRHRAEDGSCSAVTRNSLTEAEIRIRKYHGLRESEAHKRIKRLIERSLVADPMFQPESIRQERRWRSNQDPALWRRPDVQAICGGVRMAFEAQLSTTFLDVVAGRRIFYRDEGALLIWILGRLDPDYRRLTTDDLLFSNNSNILVVDEETTRLSEERRAFHLRCHFRRITRESSGPAEAWDQAIICFHELTRDPERQQTFWFDCKGTKERLEAEIDQDMRAAIFDLWGAIEFPYDTRPEIMERWHEIRAKLGARDIAIPEAPHADSNFRAMMHGLLSAQTGTPIGWDFKNIIEVAHHLNEEYPQHLLAFGHALELYGHKVLLESQDVTGKWRIKRDKFRPKMRAYDPTYTPDQKWLAALVFLFPDIGQRVLNFINRNSTLPKMR